MDGIRLWAFSICSAAVVGTIVYMIFPKGKLEKIFRFTVTLFFLCSLFSPLIVRTTGFSLNFDFLEPEEHQVPENQELDYTLEEQIEHAFRQNLTQLIEKSLQEIEIKADKILLDIHIESDNSIIIDQITIYLPSDPGTQKRGEITERLSEQFGTVIVVNCEQGG